MKSAFAILIILMGSALGFGQAAEFSLEKPLHKFPKTNEGKVLTHYYRFTNTGNVPLILESFAVTCSCTKVKLPSYPIAPGKTDSIEVTFDSNGKYYQQDRIITIQSNAKKKKTELRFKVYVVPKED